MQRYDLSIYLTVLKLRINLHITERKIRSSALKIYLFNLLIIFI